MDLSGLPPLKHADEAFRRSFEVAYNKEYQTRSQADDFEGWPLVCRFTEETLVKCIHPSSSQINAVFQGLTMHLVSTQTTIPVPRVHRILVRDKLKSDTYLEMEYIEGVDVADIWPTASWWTRLKIIWTLRDYVRQLRRVRCPAPSIPGPINAEGVGQVCKAVFGFGDDGAGPFESYEQFEKHFNMLRGATLQHEYAAYYPPQYISDSFDMFKWPLVLTHGDLHLQNLRLGVDGKLYLLDWGYSGVYPMWFESWYLSMKKSYKIPRSYLWFYWFIAGWYPRECRFMWSLGRGFRWAYGCQWDFHDNRDFSDRIQFMSLICPDRHRSISASPAPRWWILLDYFPWIRSIPLFLESCLCFPLR